MNDADLIELFPLAGLGDLLRDYYRLAVRAAARSIIEISGAADELEFYAETPEPSADTPHTPKISPAPARPRETALLTDGEDDQ